MRFLTLAALTLAGCSAGGGGKSDAADSCDPSDRVGTYLSHFEKLEGSCGDITDSVGRIDDPTFLPSNCTHDAPDRWSDADCKLERAFSCVGADGTRQSLVAVTEQQNSDGSLITGVMTTRLSDAAGTFVCSGTYRISFSRQ